MNIREQARLRGGDELVAHIDAGKKIEASFFKKVSVLVEETVEGLEGIEEQIALTAICEALSMSFANASAVTTIKAFGGQRADGILCAIRSVSENMNLAFATLDAVDAGMATKIKEAAKKGGSK